MSDQHLKQLFAKCQQILRLLKERNDSLNRLSSSSSPASLKSELQSDQLFFTKQVQVLQTTIFQIEDRYLDPETRLKVDSLKKEVKKQTNRNEYLVMQIISNTYDSQKPRHAPELQLQTYKGVAGNPKLKQQDQIQREIEAEKQQAIKEFSSAMQNVHSILQETSTMVYSQGEQIDIITQNVQNTQQNIDKAVNNLESTHTMQIKSRKKYGILGGIAVAVVVVVLICFFIAI